MTPGAHTVTEVVPAGWTLLSTTPAGGVVQVPSGTNCATVVFKNQQNQPPPPPPTPACTLSATQIGSGGASGVEWVLWWTTTNATSASINQGVGSLPLNGNRVVTVTGTVTYTLTATGPGGTVECSRTITVTPPPPPNTPACALNASPTSVSAGGSSALSWTTTNATSATLTSFGAVELNGTRIVTPSATVQYTLTATGSGGSVQCHTTITVGNTPPPQNPPACTLTASQIGYGSSEWVLTWTTSNATSASINNGIGSVALNGSRTVTPGLGTTMYALTATGAGGQAQCQVSITLQQQQMATTTVFVPTSIVINPPAYQAPIYNAPTYNAPTYNNTNTNTNNPVFTNTNSPQITVNPFINNVSPPASGSLALAASAPLHYPSYQPLIQSYMPQQNLYCSISVSPSSIQNGQSATLTWTSQGATSAQLSDGIGTVQPTGSLSVQPEGPRTYTLTVHGQSGQTATCQTTLAVGGNYVSLSQVPYTGVGDGMLGAAYYLLAASLLASIIYLVAYSRGKEWFVENPFSFFKLS